MNANKSIGSVLGRVRKLVSEIVPPLEVDMENVKNEVWADLSTLYYKYEDKVQKRAFREVAQEISEKIVRGRWDKVYKKFYRIEQNNLFK